MIDRDHIVQLVRRIRKKDMQAMHQMYEYMIRDMMTLSHRMTGSIHDAEEVIQLSFLNSFTKIHQLKDPSKYVPWLKSMVVRNSINKVNRRSRFAELPNESMLEDVIDSAESIENMSIDELKIAIDNLPDRCRQVLTLYLFEGYKHKEIANFMNISESTSKSQYRYAIKLLKHRFLKV